MTLQARVCGLLEAAQIPHALIGAAALAARGVARSTYDIDLLTTDVRVLAAALWEPLRTAGATVDILQGHIDDPLAGVIRVTAAGERPIDVVLGKGCWQARSVERADRPPNGPPVVAARDLVLLKLYAGGTQDLWDVRALLESPDSARLIAEVDEDLVRRAAIHPGPPRRPIGADACYSRRQARRGVARGPIERGRRLASRRDAPSAGPAAEQHRGDGLERDLDVEPQRPVVDVLLVAAVHSGPPRRPIGADACYSRR